MLNTIQNMITSIAKYLKTNKQKHKLKRLVDAWEYVLQEANYKHSKYILIYAISVMPPKGEYATQFVQDKTTLDRYSLKLPRSELYVVVENLYNSIMTADTDPNLLIEYDYVIEEVYRWLSKIESQYDYSLAKPYSVNYRKPLYP